MRKKRRLLAVIALLLAAAMILAAVMPAFGATSKYGEDKSLRSVVLTSKMTGSGHKHTYVKATNVCTYQMYHTCMKNLTGTVPEGHLATITIDGNRYTLRTYTNKAKTAKFTNVIRRIGGSTTSSAFKPIEIPLTKITMSRTSASLYTGSTLKLTVAYTPSNTTDVRTVSWASSNTGVATVSGGTVTAKKAGTAVITAKVGTKKRGAGSRAMASVRCPGTSGSSRWPRPGPGSSGRSFMQTENSRMTGQTAADGRPHILPGTGLSGRIWRGAIRRAVRWSRRGQRPRKHMPDRGIAALCWMTGFRRWGSPVS